VLCLCVSFAEVLILRLLCVQKEFLRAGDTTAAATLFQSVADRSGTHNIRATVDAMIGLAVSSK
jgi:hypothetical protein